MNEQKTNLIQFPGNKQASTGVPATVQLADRCLQIAQSINLAKNGTRLFFIRDMLQECHHWLTSSKTTADALKELREQEQYSLKGYRLGLARKRKSEAQANLIGAAVCRLVIRALLALEAGQAPDMTQATDQVIKALSGQMCASLVQPGQLAQVAAAILVEHLPADMKPASCPLPKDGGTMVSVTWGGKTIDLFLREK